MPTLTETRASVLGSIEGYWNALVSAQNERKTARGYYLQRLRTHTVVPVDGVPVPPDRIAVRPTDEDQDGTEYFTFPASMRTATTIHVQDGPDGKSFTCIFEFDWAATGMRQRYEIKGPTRVDSGWTEYDPTATPI